MAVSNNQDCSSYAERNTTTRATRAMFGTNPSSCEIQTRACMHPEYLWFIPSLGIQILKKVVRKFLLGKLALEKNEGKPGSIAHR